MKTVILTEKQSALSDRISTHLNKYEAIETSNSKSYFVGSILLHVFNRKCDNIYIIDRLCNMKSEYVNIIVIEETDLHKNNELVKMINSISKLDPPYQRGSYIMFFNNVKDLEFDIFNYINSLK